MNDQFQQEIAAAMPFVSRAIVALGERHRMFFERAGIFALLSDAQSRQADGFMEIAARIRLTICRAQEVELDTLPFWQVIDAINFFDDARQGCAKWKYLTDDDRVRYLAWALELAHASTIEQTSAGASML